MWNASQFLDLYLGELKGKGVQSYRKVYPNSTYMPAKSSASRMLKKPSFVQVMKYKLDKMEGVEGC